MRPDLQLRILSLGVALLLSLASPAGAQLQPWEGSGVLDDPEWRNAFLGSYGFLSGVEPDIAPSELELLREVIDLMKVNSQAAALMLKERREADSSAALDFIVANLDFQNGELAAARISYESALGKFPDFRRAHKNLGLLLVQQGALRAGLKHLTRAVELGDRDGRNFGLMGYCHLDLGNPLSAEVAYRNAVLQQPESVDWQLGLARSLLALEKHREAVALFGSLIAENPSNEKFWLLQANAFIGLDRPRDAAVNLETVRLLGKADHQSLVLLGDIYMNERMYGLAKSAYLEVIEKDQGGMQFPAAFRAAGLLLRTDSNAAAKEMLTSIEARYYESLSQEDRLRVVTLKAKLARAEGRDREAAKLLESIVQQDGTRGDALLELASYHQSQGNEAKAILLVERAERLEDFEYQALLDHAQYSVAARDYPKAAELLRRAISIKREPRVERFLSRVEEAMRA